MLPLPLKTLLGPELTQIGRLPARSPLTPFPDEASALNPARSSKWQRSLDGEWRFKLVPSATQAPKDWHLPKTRTDQWRGIQVPGVWTRQNTGDQPHYTNWIMPFALNYPEVPERNPTGLYRRSIEIPATWQRRQTILHIGGAESIVLVWCNGAFVGMGKDSRLPSEFDLTEHLSRGTNTLALMVMRWSDATWIEDQDHWFHGGIHRSVFLESRGAVHVQDLTVTADFDPQTGAGALRYAAWIAGDARGCYMQAYLRTSAGGRVGGFAQAYVDQYDPTGLQAEQIGPTHHFKGPYAEAALSLPAVDPWSAESPVLYELVTTLCDQRGRIIQVQVTPVGFRRVEMKDRRLCINGRSIVILGVNRHDHDPDNGKTVSREEMRAELVMMKQHNINAIRCSHYPNDHALLELASELGLYVLDEANVESHGRYRSVARDSRAQWPIMERTVRMVMRDKNFPCVIGWSLGNEAGHGPTHDAAAAWARHQDPTRFVHYECPSFGRFLTLGVGETDARGVAKLKERFLRPPSAVQRAATDIVCPMYPEIWQIEAWASWAEQTKLDDRPLIMCEFSHAMGNSNGSLTEYVDAFFAYPALGGGFVWDWRDQGLRETDAQGNEYWAYGSHFGQALHDSAFCCNGLVGPDREAHPALREYAWACRPFTVVGASAKTIVVTNRRHFEDSSDVQFRWVLQQDGRKVERGVLQARVAPGKRQTLRVNYETKLDRASEWHLMIETQLRKATPWAPQGYVIARDQLELRKPKRALESIRPSRTTKTGKITQATHFAIGEHDVCIGRQGIESIACAEQTLIEGPIRASLWRSPTDNDGSGEGTRAHQACKRTDWVALGIDQLVCDTVGVYRSERAGSIQLRIDQHLRGHAGVRAEHRSLWTLTQAGMRVDEQIKLPAQWSDLARVGVRFEVPAAFEQLRWFGLGPDESYPDRLSAQTVGLWEQTVSEQYHDYVTPQEHGSHEAVRWFELLDEVGRGMRILLPNELRFTARHHFDADLDVATTKADLVRRAATEVHIDGRMRGLGTDVCGPDARPAYRIPAGVHRFTWCLATPATR